jgi:hypothetical protein
MSSRSRPDFLRPHDRHSGPVATRRAGNPGFRLGTSQIPESGSPRHPCRRPSPFREDTRRGNVGRKPVSCPREHPAEQGRIALGHQPLQKAVFVVEFVYQQHSTELLCAQSTSGGSRRQSEPKPTRGQTGSWAVDTCQVDLHSLGRSRRDRWRSKCATETVPRGRQGDVRSYLTATANRANVGEQAGVRIGHCQTERG